MRRNNRGGNRNRGMGNQNSGGPRPLMGSSGPMMTDSLHLRELDLELELLKRKRQMIEEQHSMLITEGHHGFSRGNPFGYEQQSQSFGQAAHNFSNLYPESGGSRRGYGGPQGNKRPAIDPWDNSAPSPKRFGGNQPSRRRPDPGFKQQRPSRPQNANRAPLRGAARQDDKFAAKPRNLQNKGVSKPKQNSAAPNKLKSYSTGERKKLVEQASELVSKEKPSVSLVLEAEGPTHPKLVGRLELALGSIIREMRDAHGADRAHAETFTLGVRQRSLKQHIRDRLRQVMLGKSVGLNAEIIHIYRTAFPKETDLELLESIREANKPTSEIAIKLVKQGNPERYFKNNFSRLVSVSLTEMFERLKMLYVKEKQNRKPLHELVNNLLAELDQSIPEEEKQKLIEGAVNGTEATATVTEENSQAEGESTSAQEEASTDEAQPEPEETEAPVDAEKTDENVASADAEQKPEDSTEPKDSKKLNKSTASAKDEDGEGGLFYVTRFYQRMIDSYLRKNLPSILPKYREYIVDILNCDEEFKKTEAYIIQTTNERAKNYVPRDDYKKELKDDAAKKTTSPTKPAPTNDKSSPETPGAKNSRQQFFAKVIGRPALPRKQVMKVFLDEFEPTLIRKHRNIHNILYVSFNKQENYENILSRNGHMLDSKKLDIRPGEKINKNKEEKPEEKMEEEKKEEEKKEEENKEEEKKEEEIKEEDSKLLGDLGSLDDQIDDLLTTIQEDEGTENGEAQENGEAEGGEETGNTEQEEGTEEHTGNEEQPANDEQNEAMDAQEENAGDNQEQNTEDISDQAQNVEEPSDQTENDNNAVQTEKAENTPSQAKQDSEPQKVAPGPKTTRAAAKMAPSTPAKGPAAAVARTATPAKAATGTPAKPAPGTPAKPATGTPAKAVTTATVRTRRASKLAQ